MEISHGLVAHPENRIYGLALCAGIGGIELGLRDALGRDYQTICYVERELYCASVLSARMRDATLCDAPIWSDVATFDPQPWCGIVDIISAGYPCQPFSQAGKRAGEADPRHLWPHVLRCIRAIKPSAVFLENVTGHISLGLETVRADLLSVGYSVEAGVFSAAEIGAPHVRKRLFVLAHADGVQPLALAASTAQASDRSQVYANRHGAHRHVAHTQGYGCKPCSSDGIRTSPEKEYGFAARQSRQANPWKIEPSVGRVADGISFRPSALRALGNAVVPSQAAFAFRQLMHAAIARTEIACKK